MPWKPLKVIRNLKSWVIYFLSGVTINPEMKLGALQESKMVHFATIVNAKTLLCIFSNSMVLILTLLVLAVWKRTVKDCEW